MMELTPREKDKLLLFATALLAERRKARGLKHMTAPLRKRAPLRTESVNLGRCLLGNIDNVAEVLAVAEGEPFR